MIRGRLVWARSYALPRLFPCLLFWLGDLVKQHSAVFGDDSQLALPRLLQRHARTRSNRLIALRLQLQEAGLSRAE